MDQGTVVALLQETAYVGLVLAGPALLTALVVGFLISIAEAVIGIQEQTLTFVPKVVAVAGSFAVFGDVQLRYLLSYGHAVFSLVALGPR